MNHQSIIPALVFVAALLLLSCKADNGPIAPGEPIDTLAIITALSPTTLASCDVLTIRGRNFGRDTSRVAVFVDTSAAKVLSVGDTVVTVAIPFGVEGGIVKVVVDGDTAVGTTPITVNQREWWFRKVKLDIAGLAVIDTMFSETEARVGPDTVRINWHYSTEVSCSLATLPTPEFKGPIRSNGINSHGYFSVRVTPSSNGSTIAMLLLRWSAFYYGGFLGSERVEFDATFKDVTFSRLPNGSIAIRLEGAELLARLNSFVYERGRYPRHITREVVADNPGASLELQLLK